MLRKRLARRHNGKRKDLSSVEKREASLQTQTTRAGTNSAGTATGRKEKWARARGEEQQEDNSQLQAQTPSLSLEPLQQQVRLLQEGHEQQPLQQMQQMQRSRCSYNTHSFSGFTNFNATAASSNANKSADASYALAAAAQLLQIQPAQQPLPIHMNPPSLCSQCSKYQRLLDLQSLSGLCAPRLACFWD